MSKTNIKCPRCHCHKLYKFGLDKRANQKYQCRQCKRQFVLGDGDGLPKMNYPKRFNSFEKANNLIYLFIFHYNFIRFN